MKKVKLGWRKRKSKDDIHEDIARLVVSYLHLKIIPPNIDLEEDSEGNISKIHLRWNLEEKSMSFSLTGSDLINYSVTLCEKTVNGEFFLGEDLPDMLCAIIEDHFTQELKAC